MLLAGSSGCWCSGCRLLFGSDGGVSACSILAALLGVARILRPLLREHTSVNLESSEVTSESEFSFSDADAVPASAPSVSSVSISLDWIVSASGEAGEER